MVSYFKNLSLRRGGAKTPVKAGCYAFLGLVMAISAVAGGTPSKKTYRNPILSDQDLADPEVIRVDGKYYLFPSSSGRGYDVYTSSDLVHWKRQGRAFEDHRHGAWAPDVFYNKGGDKKFYLYYTDNAPEGIAQGLFHKQIGVSVANSPLGPFVDKGSLATDAIDAHLFQDDDGKMYLYYVQLTGGFKILAQPMSDPLTKKGEVKEMIHPTEPWEKISGE